jgi:hypothetical protein
MPYYSSLVQFTNVYATMSESGAGIGHGWKPTTIDEIVHLSGVAICHRSLMDNHIQSMLIGVQMIHALTLLLQIIYPTVDGS